MSGSERVLVSSAEGRVLVLTLNRPEKLNALTQELHDELLEAVMRASTDKGVGCVVLTGAGTAFCSGGDLGSAPQGVEQHRPAQEDRADTLLHHGETTRLLHCMPKPTIAMINGVAAGAGLALALACDLRIMSRAAVLTTSYVRVGLCGDLGVSYFLTQLVGPARARELLFMNRKLDAETALQWGLANRIEDPDGLSANTLGVASQLAEAPAVAIRYMKQNLLRAETQTLPEVLESEAFGTARCGRTQDAKEAALAFREKRAPKFTGS
ncbi:MAG TPA: enoyl-CoA hydratase-related protein [Steroidobacteraceae bacterium]|jgi:2-(1,2-epoxy-1,2-dihydrophenyl)acetyl-CoA isomerase